jgi:hypothetical protein
MTIRELRENQPSEGRAETASRRVKCPVAKRLAASRASCAGRRTELLQDSTLLVAPRLARRASDVGIRLCVLQCNF